MRKRNCGAAESETVIRAKYERLKAKLEKAEIKAEAYEEIIRVAEEKLKIQIRKKAGARRGDPKDNAQAERVNNTMKNELLKGMVFHDICDVRRAVSRAVDFYNNERPHMSLDMMTPTEASSCQGDIAKRWRSYRQEAIKNQRNAPDVTEKVQPPTGFKDRRSTLDRNKRQWSTNISYNV